MAFWLRASRPCCTSNTHFFSLRFLCCRERAALPPKGGLAAAAAQLCPVGPPGGRSQRRWAEHLALHSSSLARRLSADGALRSPSPSGSLTRAAGADGGAGAPGQRHSYPCCPVIKC